MRKIEIHNDGKGKYQSFEANFGDNTPVLTHHHGNFHVCGYGETEQEAISNLKEAMNQIQSKTADVIKDLNNGEYEIIEVDCLGEPLKKKK